MSNKVLNLNIDQPVITIYKMFSSFKHKNPFGVNLRNIVVVYLYNIICILMVFFFLYEKYIVAVVSLDCGSIL